jgi:hypothetical protein
MESNFARIRNAKPLLLTPEKRVLHFPATNKVRIDNNVNAEPQYRKSAEKYSRQEFDTANQVASLPQRITPPVSGYTEKGNLHSYAQGYGGNAVDLDAMSPKEQYKLGSQIGRQQNALRQNYLGHTDLHSGNIVRPNPSKRKAYLIDNDSFQPINDFYDEKLLKNLHHENGLGKPFTTGYNSSINFTQQKQMQHFANFGFTNPLPAMVDKARPYWHNIQDAGRAAKAVGQGFARDRGVQIGAGIGAAAGLVKGSGVGESEEEKARTTGLGRLGKLVGNAGVGGVVGGGLGLTGSIATEALKDGYAIAKRYRRYNIDD